VRSPTTSPRLRLQWRGGEFCRAVGAAVDEDGDRGIREEEGRIGGEGLGGELLALQGGDGSLLEEEVGQAHALLGVVTGGVAQVEKNLAGLAGGLELGGNLVDARRGEGAGLEIEDGGVLVLLLGKGRRCGDGASEGELVRIGLAGADHGKGDGGSGLAFEHEADDARESSRVDWSPMDSMTSPSDRCSWSAGEPGRTLTMVA